MTATALVFVPGIGFRPEGTRTIPQVTASTIGDTHLWVVAAAAPERTDLLVEWERTTDAPACTVIGKPVDGHYAEPPIDAPDLRDATLAAGGATVAATAAHRGAFSTSAASTAALHTLLFPPLPSADTAELRVREGEREWRLALDLVPARIRGTALSAEIARDGIVLRATALARHAGELIVGVEVESDRSIGLVGTPQPMPVFWTSTSEQDRRERTREHRRVFGPRAVPLVLEDERGGRRAEERRVTLHEGAPRPAPGEPHRTRFSVVFEAPPEDVRRADLVVQFIDVHELEPTASLDLRDVPADVELAGHRFRVASVEAYGAERRLLLEIPAASSTPRFVRPAGLAGATGGSYSWSGPESETTWMAARVDDPPTVTFRGVVLRHEGPWRLELPLA